MATNGMTIDGLNTVSSLTAQDKVPVWDNESSGEPTRKITAQNLANSVKSLASLPNTTEMNDAIAQSTAISERGDLQITSATEGASLYGSNNNFYMRYNKVVFICFSFKLENATVGKTYTITVNLPTSCRPPYSSVQSVVATNGNTTGSVTVNYNAANVFTIYADRAGTTYAIGSLMYLIS